MSGKLRSLKSNHMVKGARLTGFVGLHPYTAYTPKGVKVLVFSLGLRQGERPTFSQVALEGNLAEWHQGDLVAGATVTVFGEWKKHTLDHQPYLLASELLVHSNQPQLPLDFAA